MTEIICKEHGFKSFNTPCPECDAASESALSDLLCFDTGDVISIAEALIDLGVEFEAHSDYDDEGYICNCCDADKQKDIEGSFDFKHELNCPILKAQDLLTGT